MQNLAKRKTNACQVERKTMCQDRQQDRAKIYF